MNPTRPDFTRNGWPAPPRCLDEAAAHGDIPGAALLVGRGCKPVAPHVCGRLFDSPDSPPIDPQTIFLVASVTKPVTAAAVMLLVERGQLLLSDRVADYLPEFGNRGKEAIRVRHLLTHTSGLPDMLPDNVGTASPSCAAGRVRASHLRSGPGFCPRQQCAISEHGDHDGRRAGRAVDRAVVAGLSASGVFRSAADARYRVGQPGIGREPHRARSCTARAGRHGSGAGTSPIGGNSVRRGAGCLPR